MRFLRLLPAASALLLLLTACGGSSTPTAGGTDPLRSESPSSTESSAASPAPEPSAAASPTAAGSPASPTAARATAASSKATPRPSAQASPKPSARPSPTAKPVPPPGPTHALEMNTGYRFSPMTFTIGVGDAVRAHNADPSEGHTFTGSTWDSGDVPSGGYAKVFRFNTAGTFKFICTPHQDLGMTGTLTVR